MHLQPFVNVCYTRRFIIQISYSYNICFRNYIILCAQTTLQHYSRFINIARYDLFINMCIQVSRFFSIRFICCRVSYKGRRDSRQFNKTLRFGLVWTENLKSGRELQLFKKSIVYPSKCVPCYSWLCSPFQLLQWVPSPASAMWCIRRWDAITTLVPMVTIITGRFVIFFWTGGIR